MTPLQACNDCTAQECVCEEEDVFEDYNGPENPQELINIASGEDVVLEAN